MGSTGPIRILVFTMTLILTNQVIYYSLSFGGIIDVVKKALDTLHPDEEALNPLHPDVARVPNNLSLLKSQGKYDVAERLYKRALAIREKTLGPRHPDVAGRLNDLAGLLELQGKYDDAELLFKRALAIREKTLGPRHPDVAESLNDLAGLLELQGEYNDAELLYKRVLAIREQTSGPQHPDVAGRLNDLAGKLKKLFQNGSKPDLVFLEPGGSHTHGSELAEAGVPHVIVVESQTELPDKIRKIFTKYHPLFVKQMTATEAFDSAVSTVYTGACTTGVTFDIFPAGGNHEFHDLREGMFVDETSQLPLAFNLPAATGAYFGKIEFQKAVELLLDPKAACLSFVGERETDKLERALQASDYVRKRGDFGFNAIVYASCLQSDILDECPSPSKEESRLYMEDVDDRSIFCHRIGMALGMPRESIPSAQELCDFLVTSTQEEMSVQGAVEKTSLKGDISQDSGGQPEGTVAESSATVVIEVLPSVEAEGWKGSEAARKTHAIDLERSSTQQGRRFMAAPTTTAGPRLVSQNDMSYANFSPLKHKNDRDDTAEPAVPSTEGSIELVKQFGDGPARFSLQDAGVRLNVDRYCLGEGEVAGPIHIQIDKQYLIECIGHIFQIWLVVDFQPSGKTFKKPLGLDFRVGGPLDFRVGGLLYKSSGADEEVDEPGEGAEHNLDEAQQEKHMNSLRDTYTVLVREEEGHAWHILGDEKVMILYEEGVFFIRASIDHFSQGCLAKKINPDFSYHEELVAWPKRPGRKEIEFVNATRRALTFLVLPTTWSHQVIQSVATSRAVEQAILEKAVHPQLFQVPASKLNEPPRAGQACPYCICRLAKKTGFQAQVALITIEGPTVSVWDFRIVGHRTRVAILPGQFSAGTVPMLGSHKADDLAKAMCPSY